MESFLSDTPHFKNYVYDFFFAISYNNITFNINKTYKILDISMRTWVISSSVRSLLLSSNDTK